MITPRQSAEVDTARGEKPTTRDAPRGRTARRTAPTETDGTVAASGSRLPARLLNVDSGR